MTINCRLHTTPMTDCNLKMGQFHRSCTTVTLLSLLRVQMSLQHDLKMNRDTGELASCTVVSHWRMAHDWLVLLCSWGAVGRGLLPISAANRPLCDLRAWHCS